MSKNKTLFVCLLIAAIIIVGLYVPLFNIVALVIAVLFMLTSTKEKLVEITFFLLPFASIFKITIPGFSFFNIILLCAVFKVLLLKQFKFSTKMWITLFLFAGYSLVISFGNDLIEWMTVICSISLVMLLMDDRTNQIDLKSICFLVSLSVIITSIIALMGTDVFPRIDPVLKEATIKLAPGEYYQRFSGLTGNPNHYSFLLSILLSSYSVIIVKDKIRIQDFIIFIVLSLFGFMSVSLSFIFTYIFAIGLFIASLLSNGFLNFAKYMLIFGAAMAICLYLMDDEILSVMRFRFDGIIGGETDASSITTGRYDLWIYYLNYLVNDVKALLFGVGVGAHNLPAGASHSFYVDIMYHLGLFGAPLYIACILRILNAESVRILGKRKIYNYIPLVVFLFRAIAINLLHSEQLPLCLMMVALSMCYVNKDPIESGVDDAG